MTNEPINPEARDERVDEVILAYLQAADAGRMLDRQEFLARYPELAEELQAFFADHDRTARLTDPLRPADEPDWRGETVDEAVGRAAGAENGLPAAIGGYRPLRLLGTGGMGRVYEAADASGRRVALKLISPSFATSRTTLERFRQEGRLASMIAHPRCVFVLRADEEAGQPYIVMELMSGATLKDLVDRDGPLTPDDAIARTLDVIEGLKEAHQAGVIHRDVKPANCYLDAGGRVKIGDFGLSRSLGGNVHLTQTGGFVGTPLFASPEQLRGQALDGRTDVYSVAATLYYLLTGRAPFQHADGASVIARVVSEPPPSPRSLRPELSPALEAVVLRGLERQRERRFQSLDEFRQALLPLLPGQLTIAGLGLRVGAYLLDNLPFLVFGQFLGLWAIREGYQANLVVYLVLMAAFLLYFWFTEAAWGCSPGKRLVHLRVTRADSGESPGWRRVLVRTLAFIATTELVFGLLVCTVFGAQEPIRLALYQCVAIALGLVLRFGTMRTRNGYRGFHDFVSGTRVVQLPSPQRRFVLSTLAGQVPNGAAEAGAFSPALTLSESNTGELGPVPRQLDSFRVLQPLRWEAPEKVLLAEDVGLGRRVWIWLRPRTAGELPAARRELARPSRLRWLTAGETTTWRWDAFVAPTGNGLTDLVDAGHPLGWSAARGVLEQLTGEMEAAAADGTLPAVLTVEQVWLQPSGRVQVLDRFPEALAAADADERGLSLLRQVASQALEGRPLAQRRPLRAVVPLHARAPLDRLTGDKNAYTAIRQLGADLAATRGRPTEVTPVLRALHLAIASLVLMFGVSPAIVWTRYVAVREIMELDRHIAESRALIHTLGDERWRRELLAELDPSDPLRTQPEAYPRLLTEQQLRDRSQQEERLSGLGPLASATAGAARNAFIHEGRPIHIERAERESFHLLVTQQTPSGEKTLDVSAERLRKTAARAACTNPEQEADARRSILVTLLVLMSAVPALWVISAFVFRDGVLLRLAGLALVRSSGRNALRAQCAWRAFLVWLPWALLPLGIAWIDMDYPSLRWLCAGLEGSGLVLLAVYAALALRYPRRGPHDYLAGTYVVPR